MFTENTLKQFLAELSSKNATPGGGSASALAGALSASLLSMVCNLTIGKEKFIAVEPKAKGILAESERLRDLFSEMMEKDAEAFNKVMAAYKLPKESDEEKAERKAAIQHALKGAADVPLKIAQQALHLLELSQELVEIANPHAISDVGVAVLLAEGAVWGALLNVDINAGMIKDKELSKELISEAVILRERSSAIRDLVLAEVNERM